MATTSSTSNEFLVPAFKEYQAKPHLWDQLILAEILIPSSVIKRLPSGEPQLDIIEHILVPDPRNEDRNLFRVRTYSDGLHIKQAYDQCVAEGLLVCIQKVTALVRRDLFNRSTIPLNETIDIEKHAKKTSCPEKGVIFLNKIADVSKNTNSILVSVVVKERSIRPTSLPGCINSSRLLGNFCDVTLCVDDKEFPAHKVILAAASDVFNIMFTADFKEKAAARVDITNASAETFAKLLDFIYKDSVPEWDGCELELLQLADMYQVYRLKRLCEERIWMLRGAESLALLLDLARHTHHQHILNPSVKARLRRQVAREAAGLEGQQDWLALRTESPYTAGVIDGLLDAGGILTPILYKCEGLPDQ